VADIFKDLSSDISTMGKKAAGRSRKPNHVHDSQHNEDLDASHECSQIEDDEKPSKDQIEGLASQVREDQQEVGQKTTPPLESGLDRKQRKGKQRAVEKQQTRRAEAVGGHLHLAACKSLSVGPLIDIGANLTKPQCKVPQDLARQLVRAAAAGVDHVILTGHSVESSQNAMQICANWRRDVVDVLLHRHLGRAAMKEIEDVGLRHSTPSLTFTAGVHPHDAIGCNRDTLDELRLLAAHDPCVAIGECGLDYHRMFSPRAVQLKWFEQQVALAVELGMPLFLHERDRDSQPYKGEPLGSFHDLLNIFERCNMLPGRACIHCFTGSSAELQAYVKKGFFIGLTGAVGMQQRFAHLREALKAGTLPLSQLMLETDCPFMTPDKCYLPSALGMQGQRNEPCGMIGVCQAVAECVGRTPQEIASITTENAAKFFGLQTSSGGCASRDDLQQMPAESAALNGDEGVEDETQVSSADVPATTNMFSALVEDDGVEDDGSDRRRRWRRRG